MAKQFKLVEICDMNSGGTPRRENTAYYGGEINWAKISDIENAEGGYLSKTEETITVAGLKSINNRIFPEKTLLLAMYGSVGKTAITSKKMATNQAILGIRPKDDAKVDLHYLRYWIDSIKPTLVHRAVGGTLQNISLKIVGNLQILLPPLAIQKKIAAILDKANSLRQKDKQLLEHYNLLTQSIFYDMFGDPVRNNKNWEIKKLGDLGEWKSGGTPSRENEERYFNGSIPWISSGELNEVYVSDTHEKITTEAIVESSAKLIEPGAILLGMYDTAGLKSSINTVKLSCNQAIAFSHLEKKKADTLFIYFLIQQGRDFYRSQQRGVRQKNFNLSMIKNLQLIYPPLEAQQKFGILFQKINYSQKVVNKAILESELLFQSLLQKAFNGELVKES